MSNFEDFIKQPINLTLYWDGTKYGWTKCSNSNYTYSKIINKLTDGEI